MSNTDAALMGTAAGGASMRQRQAAASDLSQDADVGLLVAVPEVEAVGSRDLQ